MKKLSILVASIMIIAMVVSSLVGGCTSTDTDKLIVVTSTSLLSQIVERVGGDLVDVTNIIPPSQCPGHFEVKVSDIEKLANAKIFFMHGWQGEMFTQELIESADNPDLTVVVVNIAGNWMTPPVQVEAIDEITPWIIHADIDNAAAYQQAAEDMKDTIEAKGEEVQDRLAGEDLASINVMCAEQQAGFVSWVGFNIVATFGRPDTLTPQVIQDLVDQGREADVTLIIDNLQSGADAGQPLALDIGCDRIILSNFPGGFDDTETWEKAIDKNIDIILEVIAP
ncbi:MAG TPA: zinc ABC transporter substrate-binding protein [Dehalococcoidia bacterium]|nr:zinc ABC transporter substrate-binding protein [Dehalococcoidia bacterium]